MEPDRRRRLTALSGGGEAVSDEDLLTAVSLIEDAWPSERRATVQKIEAPR